MKKVYGKLILSVLSVVLTLTLVLTATYAWLAVSRSPVVSGIQVTIAGGNTILIAPDISNLSDGEAVHYPGAFDDHMNIARFDAYGYLNASHGLLPVSTADGLNWVIPTYYTSSDPEVKADKALGGMIRPVSQFLVDKTLAFANLPYTTDDAGLNGCYAYMDFWVVSPGEEYELRISAGTAESGSFVLPRMQVNEEDVLVPAADSAAASVRLGFLVCDMGASDESVSAYARSPAYDDRYTVLHGAYPEMGEGFSEYYAGQTSFTVYEPNGDLHTNSAMNGSYLMTHPLRVQNGVISEGTIAGRLAVQQGSRWTPSGENTMLQEIFQVYKVGQSSDPKTGKELEQQFYDTYLQGQVGNYVTRGSFFAHTSDLFAAAVGELVSPAALEGLQRAGAADDAVIVKLERNVPQRIRMFIWLEGQDPDCVDPKGIAALSVGLELAGSN